MVTVFYKKRASRVYENVKNPNIYCQSILMNTNVVEIHVDGEPFWKRSGE
jgi:hypothetical protein